jgi:hypothetical protein
MPDDFVQISCNLIDPLRAPPSMVYDEAADLLSVGSIHHAELVGLIPEALLSIEDPKRWKQLGLSKNVTIESRLA